MKTKTILYAIYAILLLHTTTVWAAPFDQRLKAFEESPTAATANAFFQVLQEEQFTDEPVVFNGSTPADSLRMQVWYWAAEYFYDRQDYRQAADYGLKALPLCKAGADRSIEADCLNLLSITYIRLADNEHAALYAKQCYALDEASGDPDRMSSSLNTLTAIYLNANQPAEAEKYVLRGIEMAEKAGNKGRMAILQAMASEVYHALGNDQEALKHIDEAYDIDSKEGNTDKAKMRLAQKASVLLGLNRWPEAEQTLKEVIPVFRSNGDRQSLGISLNKLGMALLSQGRKDEAVPCYREAAEIFTGLHDMYNEVHARRGLYESLWESDPTAAKAELDRFNDLKDSIYSNSTAESLARYNAEFGNNWLEVENHAERQAKHTAIIIAIALALVVAALWWLTRRRQRRQAMINEQLTAHIDQLREQYKELHLQYDQVMASAQADNKTVTVKDEDRRFLEQTINTINELINGGQVDAATVAEHMSLSLFQLRQRLGALTGDTPQEFILAVRLKRACHLLRNHPELNVTEVARLCAYSDAPNFTRAFKKAMGITPTQYGTEAPSPTLPEGRE